jgi:hypothetical protein
MLAVPRIVFALAVFVLPTLACEITPPVDDASSYGGASAPETAFYGVSPAPKAPAAVTYATTADMPPPLHAAPSPVADRSDVVSKKPALRPFFAGGETRFDCPVGYPAEAQDLGGCACVSSADGISQYPLGDGPCGDGIARVEGNECIFKCNTNP